MIFKCSILFYIYYFWWFSFYSPFV